MRIDYHQRERLERLRELISGHLGDHSVFLHLDSPAGKTLLALDAQFCVNPVQEFLEGAENLLGRGSVWVQGA